MSSGDVEELLSVEAQSGRFVIHPIQYHDIYEMGEIAEECMWTGEVDLSREAQDLKKLTTKQRHVIEMVLAFFAASDGIVIENLCESFLCKVRVPGARYFMVSGRHRNCAFRCTLCCSTATSPMYPAATCCSTR